MRKGLLCFFAYRTLCSKTKKKSRGGAERMKEEVGGGGRGKSWGERKGERNVDEL